MTQKIQAGQLCLDDYKNALTGEICDQIGHNPNADELATMEAGAADYVADCVNRDKVPTLTGLCVALMECKHANFTQCTECGEWFLSDEINQDTGEHCLACKPYYDPDAMPGGHDYY